MMKINERMPNLLTTGGIFNTMNVPGLGTDESVKNAALAYFFRSGEKTTSALVENFIGPNSEILTPTGEATIGKMLNQIYGESWQKIYEVMTQEYNPLENYNKAETWEMQDSGTDAVVSTNGQRQRTENFGETSESMEYGETNETDSFGNTSRQTTFGSRQDSTVFGAQTNQTTWGAKSSSDVIGAKNTNTETKISAFNSSGYANDNQSTTGEGQQTNQHTDAGYTDSVSIGGKTDTASIGSQTNSETADAHTDTKAADAHTDTKSTEAHTNTSIDAESTDTSSTNYGKKQTYTNTTTGNIGVMSSQMMLESEWEARKHIYLERVFADIDKYLTIPCYSW